MASMNRKLFAVAVKKTLFFQSYRLLSRFLSFPVNDKGIGLHVFSLKMTGSKVTKYSVILLSCRLQRHDDAVT